MEEVTFHRRLWRPGLALDIGAHDGLLTVPLAALPGARVLAFEPLPPAFARLRAAAGHLANVECRPEALGDAPGEATLTLPLVEGVPQEQWASLAKDYTGFPGVGTARHRVPVVTLDSLELDGVTAVKLDVEGHEAAVLRGGAATLRRCRPVLSVEVEERHCPGSTRDVPRLLESLGYRGFFWLEGPRPLAAFDAATMQVASPDPSDFRAGDPYIFTFFFVPAEGWDAAMARLSAPG